MPWKSIGVAIAAFIVSLVVLGRVSGIVVDWVWFSTIGYVDVFWTIFAAKDVVFLKRKVFAAAGDTSPPKLPGTRSRTVQALPVPGNVGSQ